jgi:hypothetical protein
VRPLFPKGRLSATGFARCMMPGAGARTCHAPRCGRPRAHRVRQLPLTATSTAATAYDRLTSKPGKLMGLTERVWAAADDTARSLRGGPGRSPPQRLGYRTPTPDLTRPALPHVKFKVRPGPTAKTAKTPGRPAARHRMRRRRVLDAMREAGPRRVLGRRRRGASKDARRGVWGHQTGHSKIDIGVQRG